MKRDFDLFSIALTILLHIVAVFLLWLIAFDMPIVQEESGLPVMMGNMGNLDTDYEFTQVTSAPTESASLTATAQEAVDPILTQDLEETVAIESGEKQQVQAPKNEVHQPTEAELRAQREKEAQAEAQNLMSNLFSQNNSATTIASSSTASSAASAIPGSPGSTEGNSTEGKTESIGGYGTFDLNGRSLGNGGLVKPVYLVQDEGRVVVTITVNPEGHVIATSINKRTNTVNEKLRDAAEAAARSTRFNVISGVNNQSGTITYYFKLR